MPESDLHSLVYSKNVVEFVTVASEYCRLIENVSQLPAMRNVENLQKILPLLYLKAALLPENEKVLDDFLEKFVTELDYNMLLQKWLVLLGEFDSFYEVFDPEIQFGEEMVTASISESLMDIYQDLKDFLTSYSFGNEEIMNDALYDCTSHFKGFWGQRLVNVLRAIHKLIIDETEFPVYDNPEQSGGESAKSEGPAWLDRFLGPESDDL